MNHFRQHIDRQGHNTCLWYEIKPTVPFLMSLPQMRNLRFSLNLTPGYSDPDVPLSHQGTSAPTPSYPPDDPPLPPPADSPRTQSPPKKIIPLDPHEQRPARMPRVPVKKSRAAKAKAREPVIHLPGQQQPAKVDKLPSLPEDGERRILTRLLLTAGQAFQLQRENFPLLSLLSQILRGNRLRRIRILILMPPLTMRARDCHPKTCFSSLFLRVTPFPIFLF